MSGRICDMPRAGARTPRDMPTVGAVVVNFNGGDRVLRVIEALKRQTLALTQIVVVDNNSTDGSSNRIRERYQDVQIEWLTDNIGLSAARNVGLKSLHTDLAFLVDHDIYADATAIELLVEAYCNHQVAVVCPRIRLLPERNVVQMQGAAIHFLSLLILCNGYSDVNVLSNEGHPVDAFTGGCLLMHRRSILDAGGFDELFFFYFEDLELAFRLRSQGLRFWCEPLAEVFHEPAEGTRDLSYRRGLVYPRRRAYLTMRNRLLVIFIHYRLRTILLLLPVFTMFEIAALLMALQKRWPAEWFRAWYWQVRHLRTILARRRAGKQRRTVQDRDILVGGTPPVAPGFVSKGLQKYLLTLFSRVVNTYWLLVRRWVA
jgi:GT2 family glycosyltransferase